MSEVTKSAGAGRNPLVKLLIDVGPLIAFFAAYAKAGIYWATGVLMVATVIALVASRTLTGRFAPAPLITAVLVVVFGGLTFFLEDPRFIMIKPTIINLFFACALGFGLLTQRSFLKLIMGEAMQLTDEGLAQAHGPVARLLPGAGGRQRDRLAQFFGSDLGELQGMGNFADNLAVRLRANQPDPAVRGKSGDLRLSVAIQKWDPASHFANGRCAGPDNLA